MKLIIDIPKDLYDMTCTPNNVNYIMRMAGFICSAIAEGTPLEDVKAEIQDIYVGYRHGYEIKADVLRIIDNINKTEKAVNV